MGRFTEDSHPNFLERSAKACLLAPYPLPDDLRSQAARWARWAVKNRDRIPAMYHGWMYLVKGMAEYRSGSYAEAKAKSAEVAFVVREDYQGMSIASRFLEYLEEIAIQNGYTSFGASVLKDNSAMIHVFRKRYPNAKVSLSAEDDYRIHMDFFDTVEGSNDWVW